jgi:hypothetical protein
MNVARGTWRFLPVVIAVAVAASVLMAACGDDGQDSNEDSSRTDAAATLHDGMRKLWEDHVTWTRLFIVSAVDDLPDAGPTTDRLLKNQDDIGDSIKPYYGDAAGAQLTSLLREHIVTAADILAAAKADDSAQLDEAKARWYTNADDIATFLSQANPESWPLAEMKSMMREHLDLTLEEAVARLQGDFASDIAAYDAIHLQILHMADMLSEGIINQFPDQFR